MAVLRTLVLIAALLTQGAPAAAKDLCFSDISDNVFVIQKARKLTKPGQTAPVIGYTNLEEHLNQTRPTPAPPR